MERPQGECSIMNVAPPLLLELLLNHSDIGVPAIGVPALTALACTATEFSTALNDVWPSLMEKYTEKCKSPPTPLVAKMIEPEAFRKHPRLTDACKVHASSKLRDEGVTTPTYNLSFEFEEEGSEWTRQEALMPVHTARYMYCLSTADLRQLQPYTGWYCDKYYRFEDVLGAGMLRFGRRAYVERLLRRPVKELSEIDKRHGRWHRVQQLQQRNFPDLPIDSEMLRAYADDYLRSGIGINLVKSRLYTHKFFLQQLSQLVPFSNAAERLRVKHLQKAYVLTNEYELVREAIKIVTAIRGFHYD